MAIEDVMGAILFLLGLFLIFVAFLAAIELTTVITSVGIVGFSAFGFLLCVTGFVMAESVMGGMVDRFRR